MFWDTNCYKYLVKKKIPENILNANIALKYIALDIMDIKAWTINSMCIKICSTLISINLTD